VEHWHSKLAAAAAAATEELRGAAHLVARARAHVIAGDEHEDNMDDRGYDRDERGFHRDDRGFEQDGRDYPPPDYGNGRGGGSHRGSHRDGGPGSSVSGYRGQGPPPPAPHTTVTLNTDPTPGARVTEIHLDLGYFRTLPGVLKILELVSVNTVPRF